MEIVKKFCKHLLTYFVEVAGFGPANTGVKVLCLKPTWRYLNISLILIDKIIRLPFLCYLLQIFTNYGLSGARGSNTFLIKTKRPQIGTAMISGA